MRDCQGERELTELDSVHIVDPSEFLSVLPSRKLVVKVFVVELVGFAFVAFFTVGDVLSSFQRGSFALVQLFSAGGKYRKVVSERNRSTLRVKDLEKTYR